MPKFNVYLPEQGRVIEADDEDEAAQIFRDGDGIFDFLEVDAAEEETAPAAPEPTDDIPY